MSALHLLDMEPDADREKIRGELSGNICSCTGYQGIVDGVEAARDALAPHVSDTEEPSFRQASANRVSPVRGRVNSEARPGCPTPGRVRASGHRWHPLVGGRDLSARPQ